MDALLRLARGIDRFSDRTGRLLSWLTLAMVLIGAFNAVVRYLARFASRTPDTALDRFLRGLGDAGAFLASNTALELQWYLFALVFLLGAGYALRHNAHVRVDVLYGRLSARGKALVNLGGTVLFLWPFCVLMLWVSWPSVRNAWAVLEASPDPGGLPRYPIKTVIPVAFVLLLVQGVSLFIRQLAVLRGVAPDGEEEDTEPGGGHV